MRVVVALGGNALQPRGEPATAEVQQQHAAVACRALAAAAEGCQLVVAHGNGPQVGDLAMRAQGSAVAYPFDVLDAQSEGMIGYLLERELRNQLPASRPIATLLTLTEVDLDDPAFADPVKFVGSGYSEDEARRLAVEHGWVVRRDEDQWRRVVASPRPRAILETRPVDWLLDRDTVVICAGGGGIPTGYPAGTHTLTGVEAVVDKDWTSALLAHDLCADLLVIATDVDGVYLDWGTPQQRRISSAHPDALGSHAFKAGSMGPKVEAAAHFARTTGRPAVIGSLGHLAELIAGDAGTRISGRYEGIRLDEMSEA